ncbi:SDR family oxidoreductase [Rubellimicrobium arenae]|uniref:SDR family oxidoreductase n=1 Tax=Rubellimicrobium arenae TaxID=2817372 RepID=UPI001B312246|nr:SDR family oxidoreductase [Rubellimicrobium arenae]
MDVRLDGRVIVITGGSQGIDGATAHLAAQSGAAGLLLVGRDPAKGETQAKALRERGAEVAFLGVDLARPESPGQVIAAALDRFGRIDGLVNAAALTDRGDLVNADPALWERLFAVNARAPFFLMQGAIRDMLARCAPGVIVNILSVNAYCGGPDLAVYSATKGALATLTRNAAHAHLRDRIRVNGIMMGWTSTPGEQVMQAQVLGKGDGWEAQAAAGMPLGRLLTPEEVAQVTIFLLSDASGLMTGALIDLEQRVPGAP